MARTSSSAIKLALACMHCCSASQRSIKGMSLACGPGSVISVLAICQYSLPRLLSCCFASHSFSSVLAPYRCLPELRRNWQEVVFARLHGFDSGAASAAVSLTQACTPTCTRSGLDAEASGGGCCGQPGAGYPSADRCLALQLAGTLVVQLRSGTSCKEGAKAMCRSKAEGGRRCKGRSGRGPLAGVGSTGGFASAGPSSLMRRSRAVVLQDAQAQLGDLLDAVVGGTPVNSVATLVSAVDVDVANQVANAISATLQAHGCPRGKWQSHLLCGAIAAVAQAMKAGEDVAKTVVTKGITAALTSCGIPRPAAGLAARVAVDRLMKLTLIGHWEAVRRAVQLVAVSMCPNVADHPAVEQYCLQPLASELLSDEIQGELAALSGGSSVAS
jgi:hypothetical protein